MPPLAPEGAGQVREAHDTGPADRLDWKRRGLSPTSRRVAFAVAEALLSDLDDEGALIPGAPDACNRGVDAVDDSTGRASADLRRGFGFLCVLMEWLPLFVIGVPSRMTRLPLDARVRYLEALEASRIGFLAMLLVAFKVPLCIPAFEEGEELAATGFDRPHAGARRKLALSTETASDAGPAEPTSSDEGAAGPEERRAA